MRCRGLHCDGCGKGGISAGGILAIAAVAVAASKHHTIEHYADNTIRVLEIGVPVTAILLTAVIATALYRKRIIRSHRRRELQRQTAIIAYEVRPEVNLRNVPQLGTISISPSDSSTRRALSTVLRATPYCVPSSDTGGNRSPGDHSPAWQRVRSSRATRADGSSASRSDTQ